VVTNSPPRTVQVDRDDALRPRISGRARREVLLRPGRSGGRVRARDGGRPAARTCSSVWRAPGLRGGRQSSPSAGRGQRPEGSQPVEVVAVAGSRAVLDQHPVDVEVVQSAAGYSQPEKKSRRARRSTASGRRSGWRRPWESGLRWRLLQAVGRHSAHKLPTTAPMDAPACVDRSRLERGFCRLPLPRRLQAW
jgi:hypothetical protein